MRKVNYLLIIGTCILLFLLAISMFPENFTNVDPYGKQYERLSYENGKFIGTTPPIAPCNEFPWGTDTLGRDMRSLIIYGCKTTLVMASVIALVRLLLALPLSIMAAYKNKFAGWLIKEFDVVFSAFPLIILCVFFARTRLTEALFINKMIPITIILAIFGWGRLATIITQKVTEILNKDFIEGEIAIGKTKLEIALQNILPHLIPSLVVLIFLEVALILVSLAQIGILSTIVSEAGFFDEEGYMNTPLEFDWPSLFIFSYYLFGSDKMWLVLYPAMAFAVSIIGFNLFAEGLRLEFDKNNSRVISLTKKIPTALSPVRYIYELRNYKTYKSHVINKTIAIVLIIVIAVIPGPQNQYVLDVQDAFETIEAFGQVVNESKDAIDAEYKSADMISEKLKNFGVLPFEGEYVHGFTATKKQIKNSSIKIDLGDKSIDLKYPQDYLLVEYTPIDGTYAMEIMKSDKIKAAAKERFNELQGKFIALDHRGIDPEKGMDAIDYTLYDLTPKGVIALYSGDYITRKFEPELSSLDLNFIFLKSEISEQLSDKEELMLDIKVQDGFKEGVNVLGYIPGCDEKLKDEYIVIGSPINYLQSNTEKYTTSEIGGRSLALKIAEALQEYGIKPKRTIVFAFWGGDTGLSRGSHYSVKEYFKKTDKTAFYIDLKDLTNMQTNNLIVDTSNVMPKSEIGQEYIKTLKKYAAINNINLSYGRIESPYAKDFYDTNRQAMVISSSRRGPIFDKLYIDNGQINEKKFDKAAQMIFNAVVEMALGGNEDE